MKIFGGRKSGARSECRGPTFTGEVWADPVMSATDGVTINNVFFSPGARTHWHRHERGQILQVVAGKGWVQTEGEVPQVVRSGDVVWIPPGERHWHGGAHDSYLLHTAISLGMTSWGEAVADADYGATES